MRLTSRELERDRQAIGIDQRVDLGRQAAARAPRATGPPFYRRWRRAGELAWKSCRSSARRPRKPLKQLPMSALGPRRCKAAGEETREFGRSTFWRAYPRVPFGAGLLAARSARSRKAASRMCCRPEKRRAGACSILTTSHESQRGRLKIKGTIARRRALQSMSRTR